VEAEAWVDDAPPPPSLAVVIREASKLLLLSRMPCVSVLGEEAEVPLDRAVAFMSVLDRDFFFFSVSSSVTAPGAFHLFIVLLLGGNSEMKKKNWVLGETIDQTRIITKKNVILFFLALLTMLCPVHFNQFLFLEPQKFLYFVQLICHRLFQLSISL
jgi:hypothetical protein